MLRQSIVFSEDKPMIKPLTFLGHNEVLVHANSKAEAENAYKSKYPEQSDWSLLNVSKFDNLLIVFKNGRLKTRKIEKPFVAIDEPRFSRVSNLSDGLSATEGRIVVVNKNHFFISGGDGLFEELHFYVRNNHILPSCITHDELDSHIADIVSKYKAQKGKAHVTSYYLGEGFN